MKALVFFGVTFGFLALVVAIVGIQTYLKEKQKAKKLHNEFINQFN